MPLNLEQVHWMPSPPLVPADPPIDFEHLARMTLGEPNLEREVLTMFAKQSRDIAERLSAQPDDAAALAHTLKGSARAIGAFRVADAALTLETAMRGNRDVGEASEALMEAVEEACAAIDAHLGRP